jgi:hypothetical protein
VRSATVFHSLSTEKEDARLLRDDHAEGSTEQQACAQTGQIRKRCSSTQYVSPISTNCVKGDIRENVNERGSTPTRNDPAPSSVAIMSKAIKPDIVF